MSAVLSDALVLASMQERELDEVLAIEAAVYTHPWTVGNFRDSLRAGYLCWTWRDATTRLVGYSVTLIAAQEAHLLNLSVSAAHQRRGYGSAMLQAVMRHAREAGARGVFLEVRPSNLAAQALYRRHAFEHVAVRRGYYPAQRGREDALVLQRRF